MNRLNSTDLESKRLLSNLNGKMSVLTAPADISTPPPTQLATHQFERLIHKIAAISPGEPSNTLSHRTLERCFKLPHPVIDEKTK